jgi:hypothetical protein
MLFFLLFWNFDATKSLVIVIAGISVMFIVGNNFGHHLRSKPSLISPIWPCLTKKTWKVLQFWSNLGCNFPSFSFRKWPEVNFEAIFCFEMIDLLSTSLSPETIEKMCCGKIGAKIPSKLLTRCGKVNPDFDLKWWLYEIIYHLLENWCQVSFQNATFFTFSHPGAVGSGTSG